MIPGIPYSSGAIESETKAVADRVRRSVVAINARGQGSGSGIIWRNDGLIVTNSHVLGDRAASVTLPDGRTLSASTIGQDRRNDLALLRIDAPGLDPIIVGDSRNLRVGELIFAIGNPSGLSGVVTSGIFSANVVTNQGRELIQGSIELRPGNSGGPLFNAGGSVIGVNCMVSAARVALAIPSHVVARFLSEVGLGPRLGLGGRVVTLQSASAVRGGEAGPELGLVISTVDPGSPAESAGIIVGDVIFDIAGRPVTAGADEFADAAQHLASGDISVRLIRGGKLTLLEIPQTATGAL